MPTAVTKTATASRAIGVSRRCWSRNCCCVAAGTLPAGRSTGSLRGAAARRNASRAERFAQEQARLGPLPKRRLETLEQQRVHVGKGSTIQVKKNTYSVPARLRGEWLEARIGAEQIEVWYAGSLVQTMERLRGVLKHRINYRHVIDWLVRKPGRSRGTYTVRTCTRR